ncbi:hypothetical protein DBV15_11330 [Temnothorax longispinosus]|uniref:Caspase family p20 domain-containing protein n=1 Tax=Temnothorax longispinosus TaxID=300112 RepID=A0A4V3SBU7_9HYME|nr:hypothetical protein DBV15_11330 [Temnothorax longispinosus]
MNAKKWKVQVDHTEIANALVTLSVRYHRERGEHPFQIVIDVNGDDVRVSSKLTDASQAHGDRVSQRSVANTSIGVQADLPSTDFFTARDPSVYLRTKFKPERLNQYGLEEPVEQERDPLLLPNAEEQNPEPRERGERDKTPIRQPMPEPHARNSEAGSNGTEGFRNNDDAKENHICVQYIQARTKFKRHKLIILINNGGSGYAYGLERLLTRGVAIIFNHGNFDEHTYLSRRRGIEKECIKLNKTLSNLNFEVTIFPAEKNYSAYDCLMIILLSHGTDGFIYAKDNFACNREYWKNNGVWIFAGLFFTEKPVRFACSIDSTNVMYPKRISCNRKRENINIAYGASPVNCYKMSHPKRGMAIIFNHTSYHNNFARPRPATNIDCENLTNTLKKLEFQVTVFENYKHQKIEDELQKGIAIIFNHETYANNNNGDYTCFGTEFDWINLRKTWNNLGFQVKTCNDYTYKEIQQELKMAAEIGHTDHDTIIISVLTHGHQERLMCFDTIYATNSLWNNFTAEKCPILAGKPKFIIRESRFVSYRHEKKGTWFVQSICKEFNENATKHEFLTLITMVCQRVAINYEININERHAEVRESLGTAADDERLAKTFTNLGFQVEVFRDSTYKRIKEILTAECDHTEHDCMLKTFDKEYSTNILSKYFTADKCPILAKKPKIIFIQACQSGKNDPGFNLCTEPDSCSVEPETQRIPIYADFVICYSSFPVNSSHHSPYRYYKMNHPKKGMAPICNHRVYDKHLRLKPRLGTDKDCEELKKTETAKISTTKTDHSENYCNLIATLTHGSYGELYAFDKTYEANTIWYHFTADNCPTLAGKPKLFIIAACGGNEKDPGFDVDNGTKLDILTILTKVAQRVAFCYEITIQENKIYRNKQVPYTTSTLTRILQFTSLGTAADDERLAKTLTNLGFQVKVFRDSTYEKIKEILSIGSWFVQSLCQDLNKNGTKYDLLTLLTFVCRQVAYDYESTSLD